MWALRSISVVCAISQASSTAMFILIVIIFITLALSLRKAFIQIQPHQEAIYILLGRPKRLLTPGLHIVSPFMRQVVVADMREQELVVGKDEFETLDGRRVEAGMHLYIRITDLMKAAFEVQNYKLAVTSLAHTTLRVIIGDMTKEEILESREGLEKKLASAIDSAATSFGVTVSKVIITGLKERSHTYQSQKEDYEALYQTAIRRR